MREFFGCYLLTSLDPKNKGRTYIGCEELHMMTVQVAFGFIMLCMLDLISSHSHNELHNS